MTQWTHAWYTNWHYQNSYNVLIYLWLSTRNLSTPLSQLAMNSHVAISSTFIPLCFLNLHPHVSFLPFPQLTLPEDTQPRWGHTLTACRMNKSQIHATTFGGCPSFDPNRSHDDDPKLADTTILEFGKNAYHSSLHWVTLHWHFWIWIEWIPNWHTLGSNWLPNSAASFLLLTCVV